MAKKTNFKRVSSGDASKPGEFLNTASPDAERWDKKPAQKKTRVFMDLSFAELNDLNEEVTRLQMQSERVVYRAIVAKELLLEALANRQASRTAGTHGQPSPNQIETDQLPLLQACDEWDQP